MQKTKSEKKARIINFFDEVAETAHGEYDAESKRALKAKEIARSIVFDMLSDIANKKILDVGCGPGKYTAKLLQRNATVVGMDVSLNMLRICNENYSNEKMALCLADLEYIPFKEKSFDVILCVDLLHTFTKESREIIIDNLIKFVTPGGMIILDNRNSWCPYLWFGWSKKNPVGYVETFSISSVTRKLKENGCYNIQTKGIYFPLITSPIVIIKGNIKSKNKVQANGLSYHQLRLKRLDYRYRLKRRTQEVTNAIKSYSGKNKPRVLDVGTADGLMLNALDNGKSIKVSGSIGLDVATESFKRNGEHVFEFVQGDALNLPFKDAIFDVVIATAVLEHVLDVNKTIKELNRVLTKNGLCVTSVPDPYLDKIATRIGYEAGNEHIQSLSLSEIEKFFVSQGFNVLKAEKFMLSPIGLLPFEQKVEKIIQKVGLDCLMCNQLIVCRKADSPLSTLPD